MELLNWDASKGSPYKIDHWLNYITPHYPSWEIVEEAEKIEEGWRIDLDYSIMLLGTLELPQTYLLTGNIEHEDIGSLNEKINIIGVMVHSLDGLINFNEPVTVYLDYPFEKIVKVIIPQAAGIHENGHEVKADHLGYYLWQIARAYHALYEYHWEEIGVWGHSIDDLHIEKLFINENNLIEVFIGS